jgi:hypothetical protein
MTTDVRNSARDVEVIQAAPEQEPIMANLLELYAHDFSEFHDVAIGGMAGSATVAFRFIATNPTDIRFSLGRVGNWRG